MVDLVLQHVPDDPTQRNLWPPGRFDDPIQVGDKWVIIEVIAKYAAKSVLLAQAHDAIRDEIFKTKLDEKARDWMRELYEKSRTEINRSLWE